MTKTTPRLRTNNNPLRIGLVVPHIFMHRDILPQVIFSPGTLALDLAMGLSENGVDATLFSPGPATTRIKNITADLRYFEQELAVRGDTYLTLLKKHPFTFVTLARQAQSELIAQAIAMANNDELDVVHIYTNEEDIALPMAQFCRKPIVFTHHDPFNFLVKYKHVFPKYAHLPWISMSYAQRKGMPAHTNWVGNIYHGLDEDIFKLNNAPQGNYLAYLGRIIQPKGVHIAITAVQEYNRTATAPLTLKIAGKHYSGQKDTYWREQIEPQLRDPHIHYVGHLATSAEKQDFLGNAQALLVPSLFAEPFGMVMIEALACGTPLIGLDSGAIPEIIKEGVTGIVVPKAATDEATVQALVAALPQAPPLHRHACRTDFENRFTLARMCKEHLEIYEKLTGSSDQS